MRKSFPVTFFFSLLAMGIPTLAPAAGTAPSTPSGIVSKLPFEYILDKITGNVMVLPKGAAKPESAEEDQTVRAGDEIITRADSEVSLILNDTTMIQVSADSDVKVAELSRKSAGGFISRLKLAAGRLLAQVEKLGKSHSVFEIETGGVVCGVRGTAFEVQREGTLVATNTFDGVVEMRKEKQVQTVPADKRSEFATDKGQFLLQRVLNEREKARYENWQRFRELADRRQAERQVALKAFDNLPQTEQDQLWQKLQQVGERDRFKVLRQMMREKNLQDRLKVIDNAAQVRANAAHDREDTARKAQEERESELKALKKKKEK